jgi:hypothetical protein
VNAARAVSEPDARGKQHGWSRCSDSCCRDGHSAGAGSSGGAAKNTCTNSPATRPSVLEPVASEYPTQRKGTPCHGTGWRHSVALSRGTVRPAAKQARLNADAGRCTQNTQMDRGPARRFAADIAQRNPASRADAIARVPSACFACIRLYLRKTLLPVPRAAIPCRHGPRAQRASRARSPCSSTAHHAQPLGRVRSARKILNQSLSH